MALSVAVLQAQLDALQTAINSGVQRVHYQDRAVYYQSVSQMLMARAQLVDDIQKAGGTTGKRYSIAQFTA